MIAVGQVVGAVLLLAGFIAAQTGLVRDTAPAYLAVNAAGAAVLATVAIAGQDWGFVLLEGVWAIMALASLLRRRRTLDQVRRRGRRLPPDRAAVRLAGDELSDPARLTRLFRDSYSAAQGRQWLQPHILWWTLLFLRHNGVQADWAVVGSPQLAERVTSLGLPAGHSEVHPAGQTTLNFRLWWPLVGQLARRAYRPWGTRRQPLPDAGQVEARAWRLGLQPWMSSASFEEMSGIGRALAVIDDHDQRGRRFNADHFMVEVLLPGLLRADLHWLHAAGGRPRTGARTVTEVVLLCRYDTALTKWTQGRYLTALDHLYLRAGDILTHLARLPQHTADPELRSLLDAYHELRRAYRRNQTETADGAEVAPAPPHHAQDVPTSAATLPGAAS